MPDIPLAVLIAGIPWNPLNFPRDWTPQQIAHAHQLALEERATHARLVRNGTYRVVDNSGHKMNVYVPARVSSTILQVVQAVRQNLGS